MRCQKCNFENLDGSVFCASCGNKMEVINPTMVQPNVNVNQFINNVEPSKNKCNSGLLIAGIVVVIVAALVVFLFLFLNTTSVKEDVKETNKLNETNQPVIDINSYQVGDEVILVDGSTWYFIEGNSEKIVLLSKSNYGEKTYFCSDAKNEYNTSHVRDIVENEYLPNIKNSILNAGGNISTTMARILSVDDIKTIVNSTETDPTKIEINREYKWLFETGDFWLSTHSYNSSYNSVYVVQPWVSFATINYDIAGNSVAGGGNIFYIRPVIETSTSNIKK